MFYKQKDEVCSNCSLQQKGWVDWFIMKCGCGCGEQSQVCFYCGREHSRNKMFPVRRKTEKPFKSYPCLSCSLFKCKRGLCNH